MVYFPINSSVPYISGFNEIFRGLFDTFCFLHNLSLIRFRVSSTKHWMTCQWVCAHWRKAWATPNTYQHKASPTHSSLTRSGNMRHWVSHLQPVPTPICYNDGEPKGIKDKSETLKVSARCSQSELALR